MIRRNTEQEQIVYNSLECLGHATSEELIKHINENYSNIALATIYRNLTKLLDQKRIKRIKLGTIDVYETVKEKHYHFNCKSCGKVIDIKADSVFVDVKGINKNTDLVVEDYDIAFYGFCDSCSKK